MVHRCSVAEGWREVRGEVRRGGVGTRDAAGGVGGGGAGGVGGGGAGGGGAGGVGGGGVVEVAWWRWRGDPRRRGWCGGGGVGTRDAAGGVGGSASRIFIVMRKMFA
jgi:hypothetical protein